MIVNFFEFSKRPHSTARPSGTGTAVTVVLKTDSSIMNPTLQISTASRPVWTYAYIPEYGRYYFISEWTYTRHALWEADLTCDVLATYKTAIGAYNGYVLRASAEYDGSIIDDMYPMPASWTKQLDTYGSLWTSAELSPTIDVDRDGCFILGISSSSGSASNKYGSIGYYAFTRANLQTLIVALLQNLVTTDKGFLTADAGLALQKAIVDPLSYIKNAMWIPVTYDVITDTEVTGLDINGWYLANVTYKNLTSYRKAWIPTYPLTKHPQAASRGSWLNVSPYTRYAVHVQPFGVINLDTSLLVNESSIDMSISVDYITGVGILEILAHTSKAELAFVKAQIGVPIAITQVSQNLLSGLLNTAGAAFHAVKDKSPMAAISAIGSAIDAITPHASTSGSTGSFSDLCGSMTIYSYFGSVLDDDNSHVGRPLCKNRTLSSIPGYIKCMDGDISVSALDAERTTIKTELEAGFYYE